MPLVGQVINAADGVEHNSHEMQARNQVAHGAANEVQSAIDQMMQLFADQLEDISRASTTAEEMRAAMEQVVAEARERYDSARPAPPPFAISWKPPPTGCSCSISEPRRLAES